MTLALELWIFPQASLLICMAVFVGAVVRAIRVPRKVADACARMPLDDSRRNPHAPRDLQGGVE